MPQDTRRKLVVIEEGTLTSMAGNAAFLAEFPFLATLVQKTQRRGGCGGCGKAAQERARIFGAAKTALAGLASDKKRRLKELLNAQQVRITYKTPANKVVALTF